MNLPVPFEFAAPADLAGLSTQALRAQLAQALTLSARTLQHLALVWKELESRGEDLSDLRTGLALYLPLIAAGQLDAEVVVHFAGNKTLLQSVSRLPLPEQHRLALGGAVDVITLNADGSSEIRQVPAHAITATQARLVFDEGRIRPPEEQRNLIDTRALRRATSSIRQREGSPIVADLKARNLKIGRYRVTPGEVLAALADLQRHDDEPERERQTLVKLSDEEHRAVRTAAAEAGMSIEHIVRTALRATGII